MHYLHQAKEKSMLTTKKALKKYNNTGLNWISTVWLILKAYYPMIMIHRKYIIKIVNANDSMFALAA